MKKLILSVAMMSAVLAGSQAYAQEQEHKDSEKGYVTGRVAPIVVDGVTDFEAYINPIPSGLVLTGIVVSVSVSAFFLSLAVRLYREYKTLDLEEIITKMQKEQGVY